MFKIKPEIIKKKLTWEDDDTYQKCAHKNCNETGKYKAPKSRSNLDTYYYFCLHHIKEYNKSWDFYKGLSVDEIELSLRKDILWDRPSWPLKGNPSYVLKQIKSFMNNDYTLYENQKDLQNFLKNKFIHTNLTYEERKSMDVLDVKMPINVEKIKKAYKRLVKLFHPDVNKKNRNAEKIFKEINQAYRILLKKFINN